MSNMSYCRFTNTLGDLQVCLDVIRQDLKISQEEAFAGQTMFKQFLNFCRQYDIIDDYDEETVDDLFSGLREGEADDE